MQRLLWIASVAILIRLALIGWGSIVVGFGRIVLARDGWSYLAYARAILGEPVTNPFIFRHFPGFPLLIAAADLVGLPAGTAAIAMNVLAAGAVCVLAGILYHDERIAWAMAILTPSWLMVSSLVASEPAMLLFTLLGLVLVERARVAAGGAAIGIAAVIRPSALFAWLAAADGRRSDRASLGLLMLSSGTVVLAALAFLGSWRGDPLLPWRVLRHAPSAYGGDVFALPLTSLIVTPLAESAPLWKVAYVWVHVAIIIAGLVLLVRRLRATNGPADARDRLSLIWLAGHAIYVASIGDRWGFHEFHRFILPALPPLAWAWQQWLPKRVAVWIGIAAASILMAAFGIVRGA